MLFRRFFDFHGFFDLKTQKSPDFGSFLNPENSQNHSETLKTDNQPFKSDILYSLNTRESSENIPDTQNPIFHEVDYLGGFAHILPLW